MSRMTITKIRNKGYYLNAQDQKERSKRDDYCMSEEGAIGTMRVFGNIAAAEVDIGVWDGKEIHRDEESSNEFSTLFDGYSPRTGKALSQNVEKDNRIGGFDFTFSVSKSVSSYVAYRRGEVMAGHNMSYDEIVRQEVDRAIDDAINFGIQQGAFQTRRGDGKKKGGIKLENVDSIVVGSFDHHVSRKGDPQTHGHRVIMSSCRRKDGTWGSLELNSAMQWQRSMNAVFESSLIERLNKRLMIEMSLHDKHFEIHGIPEQQREIWSKRNIDIKQKMAEKGIDYGDHVDLRAAVTLSSRPPKSDLPPADVLHARWEQEMTDVLASLGKTKDQVIRDCHRIAPRLQHTVEQRAELAVNAAILKLTEAKSTFRESDILAEALLNGRGIASHKDILKAVVEARNDHRLLVLPEDRNGSMRLSTPEMVVIEKRMLSNCQRKNEAEFFTGEAVDAAVAHMKTKIEQETNGKASLTEEQDYALRFVMSNDGVCIMRGGPGTGKTTITEGVKRAVDYMNDRGADKAIYALAPSNRGKRELLHGSGIDEEYGSSLQKAVARIRSGETLFDADSIVILDECGFANTRDAETLVTHCQETGAKLIFQGDERQLQGVGAGSPMICMERVLGNKAMLNEIRRQKVEWQREASMKLAEGGTQVVEALKDYDSHGNIKWCDDRESALSTLVGSVKDDVADKGAENTRLVIAATQSDVTLINGISRQLHRDSGLIGEHDITVPSIDKRGRSVPLELTENDRVIFSENFQLKDGSNVYNGDMATIKNIWEDDKKRVWVAIAFDIDGEKVKIAHFDELRGPRKDKDIRPPLMQHAYCATNHAGQGATVTKAWMFGGSALDQRQLLVGLTRHRQDVELVIDCHRAREALWQKAPLGERPVYLLDSVKAQIFEEAQKVTTASNVSDHVLASELDGWIHSATAMPEKAIGNRHSDALMAEAKAEVRQDLEVAINIDKILANMERFKAAGVEAAIEAEEAIVTPEMVPELEEMEEMEAKTK